MIFTREGHYWQIASLVTPKSLFMITRALFYISSSCAKPSILKCTPPPPVWFIMPVTPRAKTKTQHCIYYKFYSFYFLVCITQITLWSYLVQLSTTFIHKHTSLSYKLKGHFKNTNNLSNLRALQISTLYIDGLVHKRQLQCDSNGVMSFLQLPADTSYLSMYG